MTTCVILAAGRGTRIGRVGESLHKALVPLGGKAVISHIIDLVPSDAKLVVAVGHRASQVREYLTLAHATRKIELVQVDGWDGPGAGPGASLLACREAVGDDDLILTSCDTLWARDMTLWSPGSWAGVAPVPAGTPPARWCRLRTDDRDRVTYVLDKRPGDAHWAWTGLAQITREDLDTFWKGVHGDALVEGERQISGGLAAVANGGGLEARRITWTDVGDETSYAHAVALMTGYDWTKVGEATYVLPEEGRVVKFWATRGIARQRVRRAEQLRQAVPPVVPSVLAAEMLAYRYVPGMTAYEAIERDRLAPDRVWSWAVREVWRDRHVPEDERYDACMRFYRAKTLARVAALRPDLRVIAQDAVSRIDWSRLARGCRPVTFHGDFNYGNILLGTDDQLYGIDWRENFDGALDWGDRRYDVAKLVAGCRVHWDRAKRGDFTPWPAGAEHEAFYLKQVEDPAERDDVMTIGALSLLNSAPLHAAPLDEVLVARGCAWLEELSL